MLGKNRCQSILGLLVLIVSLVKPSVSFAQVSFGRLKITQIYTENFPEIKVQAIVRDEKGEIPSLTDMTNLELFENQQKVTPLNIEMVEGPIEVMFVLDLGPNLDRTGAVTFRKEGETTRQATRLEEIIDVTGAFLDAMRSGDSVGIITVGPFQRPQVNLLQSLTMDQDILKSKLASLATIPITSQQASQAVQALDEALTALQNSQLHQQNAIQAVVLVSDGNIHNFASPNYSAVLERARQLAIPIHTILVHEYDVSWSSGKLREIARETNGRFVFYQSNQDRQAIPQWADEQRSQVLFTYRSEIGQSGSRTVELRTKREGIGRKSSVEKYDITILPPEVRIQDPLDNATIHRTYSEGETVELASPKSTTVIANIRWPDGHQRIIQQAKLIITGDSNQEVVSFYPAGNNVRFTVDLTPFTKEEPAEILMWVEVTEELKDPVTGNPLVSVSPRQKLSIDVIPQTKTAENLQNIFPSNCEKLVGFPYVLCLGQRYAWLISLSLSFIALLLVVIFRTRIAGAAVQFGDSIRETVARITRPQKTEVGAYLQVLRGADDLPRDRIPLYLNTVTPIGRDKRQAELIFDEHAEQSVVSRLHCEIISEGGVYTIRDKGSTHGTYVNAKRLPELGNQQLQTGDQIEIGPAERGGILLRFELVTEEEPQMAFESDIVDRETRPMV